MEERISVNECAKIMKASERFVRASVKNGSLVGCYSDIGKSNYFFIPRKAFYKFMGWGKEEIEKYENTKKMFRPINK